MINGSMQRICSHTFSKKDIAMTPIFKWLLAIFFLTVSAAQAQSEMPRVQMETTKGNIVIELNAFAAPKTTANFLAYVKNGFYNNTIFHRVIKGFMIQGGGLGADMRKKETLTPISNEADNGLKNLKGTIAMARTRAPHSATAQFFINAKDNPFLDYKRKSTSGWGYCVFGRVIQGIEVVNAIENAPTTKRSGYKDVPVDPIIITKATVVEQTSPLKETSE